jgi:hypothetical protein
MDVRITSLQGDCMSLRVIPLIFIPFVIYNLVALLGGSGATADEIFRRPFFGGATGIPLPSGARWVFSWGDLIILVTMVLLFIELIKATFTSTSAMIDHGLSMLVFIACLIMFIVAPQAATSVFFFIMIAALIDVVAGFSIGMRTARRDLNIGSDA